MAGVFRHHGSPGAAWGADRADLRLRLGLERRLAPGGLPTITRPIDDSVRDRRAAAGRLSPGLSLHLRRRDPLARPHGHHLALPAATVHRRSDPWREQGLGAMRDLHLGLLLWSHATDWPAMLAAAR